MISPDQVTALAPDAASFKAGKGLAVASKWSDLGRGDQMIWGLAKGSGSKPYFTQVALADFASKCSCPSRKFPCKHALGLMFIAAQDASLLAEVALPDWVQQWKNSRAQREEKASQGKQAAKPKNAAAAARSKIKRSARVDEGITFLNDLLVDLIRQGLAKISVTDANIWDNAARRLIDCQAPGLARYVRRFEELTHSGHGWESRLLHEMGALYLLIFSYQQGDALGQDIRAEVNQRVGWQVDKEQVLEGRRLEDDWFVAYRIVTTSDKLKTFSNWVYGQRHKQWALLLSFSAAGAAPATLWPVGSSVTTELAFYPGVMDERAMVVAESPAINLQSALKAEPETVAQLLSRVSASLAVNPWCMRFPCLLCAQPAVVEGRPVLVDPAGMALPWRRSPEDRLLIESICGGKATILAGEWDGQYFHVHAISDSGAWFQLREHYQ